MFLINLFFLFSILIPVTGVMESDEPDAQSVAYMRIMYKACMNESKRAYSNLIWLKIIFYLIINIIQFQTLNSFRCY